MSANHNFVTLAQSELSGSMNTLHDWPLSHYFSMLHSYC